MAAVLEPWGKPQSISIARYDPATGEPDFTAATVFDIKDGCPSILGDIFFSSDTNTGKELIVKLEPETITFKVTVIGEEMRKAIDRLLYAYTTRKCRKTTYKTLRHDCAKRNGRR